VPPSVIQYQDYSNENIKFKFDTVFPKYNEAWKEAGHEPDLEWDNMYGKPTSFLLRLQIRLIQEGLPIHEAYEKAFDALKKEKEDIDMKMELEREWLEQREYDLGKQSNPWDTKDEVEGVDTNEDDGIEAETSSFSKLLLAAKNRKKMGKMEAMALEGEGDSSEIFARFKSLEGGHGDEGPVSEAEKLVNVVGGQSLMSMLSKDAERLRTFLKEMEVEEPEIEKFLAALAEGQAPVGRS